MAQRLIEIEKLPSSLKEELARRTRIRQTLVHDVSVSVSMRRCNNWGL